MAPETGSILYLFSFCTATLSGARHLSFRMARSGYFCPEFSEKANSHHMSEPSFVNIGCLHVFGAETDTDEARAEPTGEGRTFQKPDRPRWPCRSGLADASADLFPNHLLQPLRDARGECTAPLYFREINGAYDAFPERFR